jgi:hypothetical protein
MKEGLTEGLTEGSEAPASGAYADPPRLARSASDAQAAGWDGFSC